MSLIKCRKCGQEVAEDSPKCLICGASSPGGKKLASTVITHGLAAFVGIIAGILIADISTSLNLKPNLTTTESSPAVTKPQSDASSSASVTFTVNRGGEEEKPKAETPPPTGWMYAQEKDSMSNGTIYAATVVSNNTVSFSSPYEGNQRASIQLAHHPRNGLSAAFMIEQGQFGCNLGCTLTVRFDQSKAIEFAASPPSDHSSTIVFIDEPESFISALKKAKTVRIESTFYEQGNVIFEFNVAGLDKN